MSAKITRSMHGMTAWVAQAGAGSRRVQNPHTRLRCRETPPESCTHTGVLGEGEPCSQQVLVLGLQGHATEILPHRASGGWRRAVTSHGARVTLGKAQGKARPVQPERSKSRDTQAGRECLSASNAKFRSWGSVSNPRLLCRWAPAAATRRALVSVCSLDRLDISRPWSPGAPRLEAPRWLPQNKGTTYTMRSCLHMPPRGQPHLVQCGAATTPWPLATHEATANGRPRRTRRCGRVSQLVGLGIGEPSAIST